MEFRVLGPVEAWRDGDRIPLSGTKIHTVLSALVLANGQVVSDDKLSWLLWGWNPPATKDAQLYTYVSRLRKRLGQGGVDYEIVRRVPGYAMNPSGAQIDIVKFSQLAQRGREALADGDYHIAGSLLREALAHWRGPAFSNVTEFLAETEVPRLAEERAAALENRVEADLAIGRHQETVVELTTLVAEHPLRERLRGQLMVALYRCGRQADALRVYHEGRVRLADEFGVDPGAELAEIYHEVLTGTLALKVGTSASPPKQAQPARISDLNRRPAMLPADIAEFIGREEEQVTLARMLDPSPLSGRAWRPRHFLITGMAGVGKTALAVRAGYAALRLFPDGQLYASMRNADGTPRDTRAVLVRLLRSLGQQAPDYVATDLDELTRLYRAQTEGKRLLILLDDAAGDRQLAPLLSCGGHTTVLITSRSCLAGVDPTHTVALAPLAMPDAIDVLAVYGGPARMAADPHACAEIARYSGGLPLALRIAGTRIASRPHRTPAALARRLADPATRLDELRFGDVSVRNALFLSLRALGRPLIATFVELPALGADPFTAYRAGALLRLSETEAERRLDALVDAALLDVAGADRGGSPCYQMHPLVRLVAASVRPRTPAPTGHLRPATDFDAAWRTTPAPASGASYDRRPA